MNGKYVFKIKPISKRNVNEVEITLTITQSTFGKIVLYRKALGIDPRSLERHINNVLLSTLLYRPLRVKMLRHCLRDEPLHKVTFCLSVDNKRLKALKKFIKKVKKVDKKNAQKLICRYLDDVLKVELL